MGHVFFALLTLGSLVCLFAYSWLHDTLQSAPPLDKSKLQLQENVQILDRLGGPLYQFIGSENRINIPSESIPDVVKKAFIAIEDERFLTRKPCIDVRSVVRAFVSNLRHESTEGASTITQQLVRMLYLTREKTYTRKINEIILSCRLERILSKDEILMLYLNGINFGNGLYGIEQAAQTYFGIAAKDMSIVQAAALAAIPQRPTHFNPYGVYRRTAIDHAVLRELQKGTITSADITSSHTTQGLLPRLVKTRSGSVRLQGRADFVLDAMQRQGFMTDDEARSARDALPTLRFQARAHPILAPHFSLWMRDEIASFLRAVDQPNNWRAQGITVRTTLDPQLQFIAEDTIDHLSTLLTTYGVKNIALVALDKKTRSIVAYTGNTNYFADETGQIDMAQVPRQPGSSFKPIVYAAAFMNGYTTDTMIKDEPIAIGSDIPKNYDGGFLGWLTMSKALSTSRNIPAIKTYFDAGGEEKVLHLAYLAGAKTPFQFRHEQRKRDPHYSFGWPLALGSAEIPLLEMTSMYATIANHGIYKPPQYFCSLRNRRGDFSLALQNEEPLQAIPSTSADAVESILSNEESKPEGYWRYILTIPGVKTGAKTGTSNYCYKRSEYGTCTEYGVGSVWTIGYSDSLVVGVWAGNADNTSLSPLADGLTVAAPIWREFLLRASQVHHKDAEICE